MSDETDKLRAQLEMVELEEQLRVAKNTDEGASDDLRLALREARYRYRTLRDANPDVPGPGDVAASPATIDGSVGVQQ